MIIFIGGLSPYTVSLYFYVVSANVTHSLFVVAHSLLFNSGDIHFIIWPLTDVSFILYHIAFKQMSLLLLTHGANF